jgi:hypothetical protein
MLNEVWDELQGRIAREDFAGAFEVMAVLESSCQTAATAEDWAMLSRQLRSALILARVKRAHLELQFNELSEKRSRRSAGGTVCDAYERNC